MIKQLIALILCVQLSPLPAFAAGSFKNGFNLPTDITAAGVGSEFISGNYPGAVLMPINLWGSVAKPGIHHVPTQTDLVTLLSLAGGPGPDAELGRITIKRRAGAGETVIRVDAEDILTEPGRKSPVLEPNDIIIIPREKPTVSPNTMTTISFIGGVLGIILAGFALSRQAQQ